MGSDRPNLAVCHGCPHRQRPCNGGGCVCTLSGKGIIAHAEAGECPLGRFTTAAAESRCERCGGAHLIQHCPIPEGFECGDGAAADEAGRMLWQAERVSRQERLGMGSHTVIAL